MKKVRRHFAALFVFLLAFAAGSHAQQPNVGCIDKNLRLQADEIKQHYVQQGFTVYRDAMVGMQSMSPFPIVVQMSKGQLYQIIFVANQNASKQSIDIYNGRDQKIDEKKATRNREQPNYIQFTFIPEQTDNYLFVLMQKWKAKDICGSFTILKPKADAPKDFKFTPYVQQ